jgi:hypothetical protein
MTEGATNRHSINCTIEHETEKAWLINDGGGRKVWVPKSQAEAYPRQDGTIDLFAEEWVLKKKGLI